MADKLKERISLLEEAEARAKAMGKALKPEAQTELDTYRQRGLAKTSTTAASGNASVEERKANSFLLRALGANSAYEKTGVGPRSLLGQSLADSAPNVLNSLPSVVGNSDERQVSDSAQAEFIAASLRQDSGAAIPPAELEGQRRIYFPMPGDSAAAIEQKRQARIRAIEGLYSSAGRALTDDTRKTYSDFMKIPVEGLTAPTADANSAAPPPLVGDPARPTTSAPIFDAMNAGAYGRTAGPETIDTEFKAVDNPDLRAKNEQVLAAVAANQPDEQVLALAQRLGVDPAASGLNSILAYRKKTGLLKYADTTDYQTKVPLTPGEKVVNKFVASPVTEFVGEAGNAAAAGIPQAIAIGLGGDDMQRKLQAAENTSPRAAIAGKLVGTVAGAAGTELAATRLLAGSRFAAQGARAGDVAFGAASGATGNPDDPVMGAVKGAATNLAGGEVGRAVIGGVASAVSPAGGKYADLYADGVRPTLGQRLASSGGEGAGPGGLRGVIGTTVNTAEQALGSVPVMGAAIRGAREEGVASWERAGLNRALRAIGEDPLPRNVPVGPEAMRYVGERMDNAYDEARAGMMFTPDDEFGGALREWQGRYYNGVLTDSAQTRVNNIIADVFGSRLRQGGGVLTGDTYKRATSDLSKAITTVAQPEVKLALRDFNDILRAGARRVSDPAAANAMDASDRGWALFKPLRDASAMAGSEPGRFTPTSLASVNRRTMGRSRAYIEGDSRLGDYINRGSAMRDTLGNSGTFDRQAAAGLVLGTGGAMVGPTVPVSAIGLTLPYLPGVRNVVAGALAPRETPALANMANAIRANYQPAGGPVGQGLLDAYLEQRRMQNQPGIAGAYR